MTHETSDETSSLDIRLPERDPPRRGLSTRQLMLAGVAAACLLGVGLGIWARPAMSERRMATVPAARPAPALNHQIQIVVDDAPAPIGKPIDVLPAVSRPPEPMAPVRPAQGVTQVRSAPPLAAMIASLTPRPATRRADKPPVAVAEAHRPDRPQIATAPPKVDHAGARAWAVQLAKATAARHRKDIAAVRLAKAETRAQAREKAHQAVLAQADEARRHERLVSMVHALAHLLPHYGKAEPAPVMEKVSDRHGGHGHKTKPAKLQKAVAHAPAKPARRPKPLRVAEAPHPAKAHAFTPPPKPIGLMKVSNRPRCASPDPGAALVCADPSLGAADRQLARAYRDAQAAGVSSDRLQHQQQRWLAARSAAAREAPWAVHDVYVARIAELNGMAHEAQGPSN